MTDTFTTQCPHCQTDVHLQRSLPTTALSDVRCDTCQQVFNAARQISHPATAPQAAIKPSETLPPGRPEQQKVLSNPALTQPLTLDADADLGDLDILDFEQDAIPLLHKQRLKKSSGKGIAWLLLSTLLVLLLLGLYIYGNFNQLARQDSTRPWLAVMCPILDCQLPPKVDVQQFKSSNLQVRYHPEFSGAVLVDAIIYNRASFSQAFPLLELVFIDQHDQPLISRRFKPEQYLSDRDAQQQMQPQIPIHIAIETLKSSDAAVNYRLNFVAPD